MQQSNRPAKFLSPFAQGDAGRAEVPLTTPDSTRASQTLGFPPLTGTPPEAGGVPPQREDMNGVLNQASRLPWWYALGGRFPFDAAFAGDPAINGYPQGSVLPATLSLGEWYSTADNNTADPEGTGAGWVPGYHYGATVLTAQTGGNVALTPNQAAKRLITVSGTLTSNLVITVPEWLYAWDFINNTGGAFTVSVKYPTSGAVVIPQTGTPVRVLGDGSALQVATQIIPSATNVTPGIQRNATNSEAAAGLLTDATITPASMASAALLRSRNLADVSDAAAARSNLGVGVVGTLSEIQIANVTGLPTALTGKYNTSGGVLTGDVSVVKDLPTLSFLNASANRGYRWYGNFNSTADFGFELQYFNGAGWAAIWRYSGGTVGTTQFPGAVFAAGGFQDGSSRTIKHHIADLDPVDSLTAVLALQGVRYRYHGGDADRLGYYAEDTREVIPEAVHVTGDGAPSPLSIEDTQMLPHHTGAIQALHQMITELQARVAELENKHE